MHWGVNLLRNEVSEHEAEYLADLNFKPFGGVLPEKCLTISIFLKLLTTSTFYSNISGVFWKPLRQVAGEKQLISFMTLITQKILFYE